MRSAQAGKEGGVLEIRSDSEGNKNDAEDDSSAKIELDERADEVKAEQEDQGTGDRCKERAVLAQKRAHRTGGGAEGNENDGKAGDKGQSRREQARGWD